MKTFGLRLFLIESAFSQEDIEFNEKKSFNCQAYSAAFYVSLVKNKKMSLNKIQSPVDFKSIAPKKFIKNYQPQLL